MESFSEVLSEALVSSFRWDGPLSMDASASAQHHAPKRILPLVLPSLLLLDPGLRLLLPRGLLRLDRVVVQLVALRHEQVLAIIIRHQAIRAAGTYRAERQSKAAAAAASPPRPAPTAICSVAVGVQGCHGAVLHSYHLWALAPTLISHCCTPAPPPAPALQPRAALCPDAPAERFDDEIDRSSRLCFFINEAFIK